MLAIKQTRHLGFEGMKKAIRSVARHEQDHIDARPEQRNFYHELCVEEQNCKYKKFIAEKNDPADFIWTGKQSGGLLAKRDKDGKLLFEKYPEALIVMVNLFEDLIDDAVLARSTRYVTQNQNESGHGILWNNYLHKIKHHSYENVRQGCLKFLMKHNFGAYKSSIHNILGTMTNSIKASLMYKDRQTIKSASHKWIPTPYRYRTHRKQTTAKKTEQTVEEVIDIYNHDRKKMLNCLIHESYASGVGDGPSIPEFNTGDEFNDFVGEDENEPEPE